MKKPTEPPAEEKKWVHKSFICTYCGGSLLIEMERLEKTGSTCRFCDKPMEAKA